MHVSRLVLQRHCDQEANEMTTKKLQLLKGKFWLFVLFCFVLFFLLS